MKGLFFAALAIHWFNPFVWAAFFLMIRDMEMSCDEAVLVMKRSKQAFGKVCGNATDVNSISGQETNQNAASYSEVLLNMASAEAGLKKVSIFGPLAFGESSVAARIKNALCFRPASFRTKMVLVAACAAIMLACSCNPSSRGTSLMTRLDYYLNKLTADSQDTIDVLWNNRTDDIGDLSIIVPKLSMGKRCWSRTMAGVFLWKIMRDRRKIFRISQKSFFRISELNSIAFNDKIKEIKRIYGRKSRRLII